MVMDDTAKDQMILIVLAEQGTRGHTAKSVSKLTERYEAPVSVRDVAARLPHLKARSYVIQSLADPQVWYITPAGIKWAEQNRRK